MLNLFPARTTMPFRVVYFSHRGVRLSVFHEGKTCEIIFVRVYIEASAGVIISFRQKNTR